jgi:hypothetical protein
MFGFTNHTTRQKAKPLHEITALRVSYSEYQMRTYAN